MPAIKSKQFWSRIALALTILLMLGAPKLVPSADAGVMGAGSGTNP